MNRLLPGLLLAALWVFLLLKGPALLVSLVVLLIAAFGGFEYARMALPQSGIFERLLLQLAIFFPVALTAVLPGTGLGVGLFLSFFLLVIFTLVRYPKAIDAGGDLARMVLGVVYVGLLSSHLLLLTGLPDGPLWLLLLTMATAGSDSAAYYCGRAFGRRKLCPFVSPKKTVEGAVGGVAGGLVAVLIASAIILPEVKWSMLVPLMGVLIVIGIIGDLCESILKRSMQVKDSGTLLAGHGGVLDRLDSLLLTAPFLYYFLMMGLGS
ncbi:MAG: phosphatidate cytidylyltransferase [Desulfobulbaceae bacterium]|uniref:Phosphatidate cytidylyltransferase n=1 Tax=Candidatus Desulfatifera sulfidica TaxID=2841691 RepID=A0A8J6N818_9BACT|nr:phosphatidate cytidylyltransferase [Candidatus Desulfatifera sulfidica]